MNRLGRAVLMLVLGAVAARLLWSGGYGWFVQQRMFIPLLLASIALLALGGVELIQGLRDEQRDPTVTGWAAAPTVGWLLGLPLLVLISVAPTGLGAAAAGRVEAFTPTATTRTYDPLDTSGGPIEMRVYDFLDRAIWDPEASLDGVPVRLEGLVVNDDDVDDGFRLTRFLVSCCAADGIPLQVVVHGADRPYDDDTWVVADVIWRPPEVPYDEVEGRKIVEADAVSIRPVADPPSDAYESPY